LKVGGWAFAFPPLARRRIPWVDLGWRSRRVILFSEGAR
jgi:hypothetical protein